MKKPQIDGEPMGFGFGVPLFSTRDVMSDDHEVVDVDIKIFKV